MSRPMSEAQRAALEKARRAAAEKRKKPAPSVEQRGAGPPELAKLLELPAAPPKMRRSSKDPKTAPAALPSWVKNAEAGPPFERAVETSATPVDDAATSAEKSSTPRPRKSPAKPARVDDAIHPKARSAPAGTLRAVGSAWLTHLEGAGKSESTVTSYGKDLQLAYEFFGDVDAAAAAKRQDEFGASKLCLMKKSGKPRAKPTIEKTRRALRMALAWGAQLAG